MDRLLGMEIFVAAVERGSFAAASRAFQITPPMVGKHIRALEERLGARLLTRTTRRQTLTEIGRQYYERCKQILQDIHSAERGAETLRSAPRGELRPAGGRCGSRSAGRDPVEISATAAPDVSRVSA